MALWYKPSLYNSDGLTSVTSRSEPTPNCPLGSILVPQHTRAYPPFMHDRDAHLQQ